MKIIKYKYLNNNKYKIYLDSEEIILYEDIIVKYNILSKKEISNFDKELYLKENIYYDNYYKALKYINYRLRSSKEIYNYLIKQNVSISDINKIIDSLTIQGYIDDKLFARSYINDTINMKLYGPEKIKKELLNLGINEEIISLELNCFTKEIRNLKIRKYIDKQVKNNHNKSLYLLKNTILLNLINMGYNREEIMSYLDNISIDESIIYEKTYNKLFNTLSKRYSGYELEQKIKQKLYQKGLLKK